MYPKIGCKGGCSPPATSVWGVSLPVPGPIGKWRNVLKFQRHRALGFDKPFLAKTSWRLPMWGGNLSATVDIASVLYDVADFPKPVQLTVATSAAVTDRQDLNAAQKTASTLGF